MSRWKLFLIAVPCLLILDLVWLGVVMKDFYAGQLGELARRSPTGLEPRWEAAILVYVFIPLGLVLFVPPAAGPRARVPRRFAWGALFGLILYGVYDLTNLAILEKWTRLMTVADMVWGCVLCGTISAVLAWVEQRVWSRTGRAE